MPGHSLCLLSCFPQYSCTGDRLNRNVCAGNDEAISFLEGLLDDILDIFDGIFIHCGGDEVIKSGWQYCPKCTQRMKDNGLLTYDKLHGWFTTHFLSYLESKGWRLIGWDEILDSYYELPESTVVMAWNGLEVGLKAARLELDVILSPSPYLYLDYCQFAVAEQYEYFGSFRNCYKIHPYDPLRGLEEQYHKHILGVQGDIGSAYTWSRDKLQYKTFTRCLSVAEIASIVRAVGFCFGDSGHSPSILLEFCASNLKRRIKKLTASERVGVIVEVSSAMESVHSAGVIHRDLKLENILLDDDNHAKVSDFGLSGFIEQESGGWSRTQMVGTASYMAPELVQGRKDYDEKVDVYAFGVVVFMIVTKGERPGISAFDVGNGKKAAIPMSVSRFSRNLIEKCWSFKASDRPSFSEINDLLRGNEDKLI